MKRAVLLGRIVGAVEVETFVAADDGMTYVVFPGSKPIAVDAADVYPIYDEEA